MAGLLWSVLGSWYPLLAVLNLVCLLHALVIRRAWGWVPVLLLVPGVGAIAYLLIEVLPELRAQSARLSLELPVFRRLHVGRLERAFRFADTVEHRVALAEAYLNHGRTAEALELYRPVITGVLRQSAELQYGYARACYVAGRYAEAAEVLVAAESLPSSARRRERWLVQAMARERLGEVEAAEALYRKALPGFPSEEARARLALCLARQGRRDESDTLFRGLLEHAAVSDRRWRRQERVWLRLARQELAAPRPAHPVAGAEEPPVSRTG